jgi:hypothetical protein
MTLRLPESGSIVESLLSNLGRTPMTGGGPAMESVTEADLLEAIAAMERGDIEYVILEEGDTFLQAAGAGDGPYALEWKPGPGGDMFEVSGGADLPTIRRVLLDFRRGGAGWRVECPWTAMSI